MSGIRKIVDWQAIERDYRAGVLSLRELSAAHGINHVSIKKRADKAQWTRDLAAKIQAKADAIVNRDAANRSANAVVDLASEGDTVNSNALAIANVRLGHRKDIQRFRALSTSLFAELEAQSIDPDLLEQFANVMRRPDDKGIDRANDLMQKVISLPGRTDTMKKLAETMRLVVSLEREAWGLDKATDDAPKSSMAAWLESMQKRRSALPVVHEVERDDAL